MKRIEYRALPPHRRHAYTRAVHRLTTLPSRLGLNTSLNDDFTYIHIQLKYQIHHAAIALPWHRYFLHVYKETLRSERGWDGWLPYWDWTLGSGNLGESEIWDAWSGFGGNGTEPQSCVLDSPLGDFKPSYREFGYEPHCVTRKFEEMHSKHYTPEIVRGIVKEARTYDEFRERLEDGPHRHLHKGIGGEMKGISSTNGRRLFSQTFPPWMEVRKD
jgi:tyrosinase